MKNKITIFILSFNRPKYLERSIEFIQSYKKDFDIFVLDSSNDLNHSKIAQIIIKHNNISLIRYSEDIFFVKKIFLSLKYLKNNYVLLSTDDDFIVPDSIIKSKNFLSKNSDYSSCHGLYLNHKLDNNYNDRVFFYELYKSQSRDINYKQINLRIDNYLNMEKSSKYSPFYALHRSEDFKKIWQFTNTCVTDWSLSEYVPCCISLILGKMKVLPITYMSREINDNRFNFKLIKNSLSETKIKKVVDSLDMYYSKKNFNDHYFYVDFKKKFQLIRIKTLENYKERPNKSVLNTSRVNRNIFKKIKNKIAYLKINYFIISPNLRKIKRFIVNFNLSKDEINISRDLY